MAELTYNQIFDGITKALSLRYPDIDIFGQSVEQELTPDSINVVPVSVSSKTQLGGRQERKITFDVIYYPDVESNSSFAECLDFADRIPSLLSTVTTLNGCKIHTHMHETTVEDGVSHCVITVSYFVYTSKETELMRTLDAEFMKNYRLHIGGYA